MVTDPREISDLVVAYDPETLARRPVRKSEVVAALEADGLRQGARIVAGWPSREGYLVDELVDRALLRAHHELQRLSEEFRQGERTARLLRPLLTALRASGQPPPYRVVDVGCGLGYVVRWLAAWGRLGADVELVGCDYNAAFIGFAQALADEEGLACRFAVANAFQLAEPATVYLSTGVIHHFRGAALELFCREQMRGGRRTGEARGASARIDEARIDGAAPTQAFLHTDIKPTYLAPFGSWLFHRARMREPLAQHDGVLSAMRAHSAETLLAAGARGGEGWRLAVFDGAREALPLLKVMQTFIGVRAPLRPAFVEALGVHAGRLGPWTDTSTLAPPREVSS